MVSQRLQRLSRIRWAPSLQACLELPAVGLRLRLSGFRRTLLWANCHPEAQREPATELDQHRARQLARAVNLAARRGPYRTSCLPRSLCLLRTLRRRGIPAELKVGGRTEEEKGRQFIAHAWVEVDQVVVNDSPAHIQQYQVFELPVDLR